MNTEMRARRLDRAIAKANGAALMLRQGIDHEIAVLRTIGCAANETEIEMLHDLSIALESFRVDVVARRLVRQEVGYSALSMVDMDGG